jgi:drug/metabolite transporter (DMT)-like permease
LFLQPSSHLRAALLALFVTFLWATSWVLIKLSLHDIPALTFAGLRYVLASLCLLPFVLRSPGNRAALRDLPVRDYGRFAVYGLIFIAITQGAQFLGLQYLPAVTVSLLLNFSPVVVALLGMVLLSERPTVRQWLGVGLYLLGILVYFYPVMLPDTQLLGVLITLVGVLANSISSIMGRGINRQTHLNPLLVTAISMSVGSVVLLATGIVTQGLPSLTLANWLTIGWLALVNTALAFPLWNHTLRTLSAVESSIINSTMLVQIALLAYIFLGETLAAQDIAGMALVVIGTLVVQIRNVKRET